MPGLLGGINAHVQEALDLYYSALPPTLSMWLVPLLTALLAVLLAHGLWAAATARPVPTIEVPLNPGALFVCVNGSVDGGNGRRAAALLSIEGDPMCAVCVWTACPPPNK